MADDLARLILAWYTARRAVSEAQSKQKFLTASADLWEAERALEQGAIRLEIFKQERTNQYE